MEIVISTYQLGLGGSESYVLTVAEQLQRLGHGVTVFAVHLGVGAEIGRERGLVVCDREDQLPETCNIVFAQESVTAYQFADSYPTTPQVFAVHADEYDLSMPPQLPDVVQAAVVLNERVARRVRALALVPEVIRLRQPVDTQRFRPLSNLRKPARRVLLLGNYIVGDRRDLVVHACTEAGLECVQIGVTGAATTLKPELELCRADIVIGKARVIVEAMSCGRAAYVFDHDGGDGWVTPERYPLLEADNFGGQAEATATDVARLRRDLAEYSPEMGPPNRDLAVVNHSANKSCAGTRVAVPPARASARARRGAGARDGPPGAAALDERSTRLRPDARDPAASRGTGSGPSRAGAQTIRRPGARACAAAWRSEGAGRVARAVGFVVRRATPCSQRLI